MPVRVSPLWLGRPVTHTEKSALIDLTAGSVKTELIPIDRRKRLLGGRGLNIESLCQMPAEMNALGPGSIISVGVGLLAGMLAPCACRTSVACRSPLTGHLAIADVGGSFAPELRRAGFDQLVITGAAKRPTLVLVRDGRIKLQDASFVWGQSIPDAQELLRKHFEDDDVQSLCIGPAGENRVRFATVSTRHHGANRQGGVGAVFGSKNLKAIVAKGTGGIPIARPEEALEYDRRLEQTIDTAGVGFDAGGQEDGQPIDLFTEQRIGPEGCYGCRLRCESRFAIRRGPHAGTYGYAPGLPLSLAWQQLLGQADADAALYANYLVNSYGLDGLETVGLITWIMELFYRGILTVEETGGLDLQRGGSEAVFRLVEMIASKVGLGALLAEGGARAADRLGKGSALFLKETRGMTDTARQSNSLWQSLGTATASAASDHARFLISNDPGRLKPELLDKIAESMPGRVAASLRETQADIPALAFWAEMTAVCVDMLGICDLGSVIFHPESPGLEQFSRMLALNRDFVMDEQELWRTAERVSTMERIFNLVQGYRPSSERLSSWYSPNADAVGPLLQEKDFNRSLSEYYALRGWDAEGIPTVETLKRLDLEGLKVAHV